MHGNTKNISKELLLQEANGVSTKKELCKKLCIAHETLNKLLKQYNITNICKRDKYAFVTPEYIKEHWLDTNRSLAELIKLTGVPEFVWSRKCVQYGIKKPYKYKLNENKLFNTLDPNVWYLAGLLATDGYINTNANFITVSLVGDDEYKLLTAINSYFENTKSVTTYKKEKCDVHVLRFAATNVKQFFIDNFNLSAKDKTFVVDVPINFPSEACAQAYVLGCLDGDGCISHVTTKPTIALTTVSQKFIDGLASIITQYTGIKCNISHKKYSTLCVGTLSLVKQLLDWVYAAPIEFKLERKFKKYLQVNDIV